MNHSTLAFDAQATKRRALAEMAQLSYEAEASLAAEALLAELREMRARTRRARLHVVKSLLAVLAVGPALGWIVAPKSA